MSSVSSCSTDARMRRMAMVQRTVACSAVMVVVCSSNTCPAHYVRFIRGYHGTNARACRMGYDGSE